MAEAEAEAETPPVDEEVCSGRLLLGLGDWRLVGTNCWFSSSLGGGERDQMRSRAMRP